MARTSLLLLAALSVFFSHAYAIHTLDGARPDKAASDGVDTKVYIVFTERQPAAAELSELHAGASVASFHHDLLSDVLDGSSSAPDRVVYHYSRSLHGFAARLTEEEKNKLAGKDGVLSIHEKVVYRPQTTRSWDFLGLPQQNDPTRLPFENDVIIGMIDTGIWPESDSFSDEGLPPPPAKWKGVCSKNFTSCNNKIIGARAYKDGNTTWSPLDLEGHGTHTASTAAGRAVPGASLGGLAAGTARGAVPGARLAIYKVCWDDGCSSEDILAAFDDAIADGVDVLSVSLGGMIAVDYSSDYLAIGAFHAMRHGIVTSVSGGNDGPGLGTISNVSPWTISNTIVVAATSTDRKIISELVLGNGKRIVGNAITVFPNLGKRSLLVDPGKCGEEELGGKRYKGAVLLCGDRATERAIHGSGADGAIVASLDGDNDDIAFSYAVPTILVPEKQYDYILAYYNSTKTRLPMATVMNSATVMDAAAPSVASFSSRGPNRITFGILKPDISAPGVDILAAWSGQASVSGAEIDGRRVPYNIISGTSMACPHVSGVAAYVKSVHPDWSPAAVMSALVTTATPVTSGAPEAELAYGAGQVNPLRARYPGLVYDASEGDYIGFLCAQGYNKTQLATMTGKAGTKCPADTGAVGDLNYPSIAVPVLNYGVGFAAEFPRTVTNVGPTDSVYHAKVTSAPGIKVTVTPDELAFSADNKTLSFTVRVSGSLAPVNSTLGASASVVWSDGRHEVRSPIYVFVHKHVM
ncbi:subtilisin-like protease SBT4.9 [Phragmites australis]|uniref:subtilisin-like protease SBT4.9 n=1 Tax=Phragmites australis TaxID=29695 RepID=UPI002D7A0BA6|nr:subtilisin-like protease SBT4.9 [Phragmites australis]